MSAAVSACLPIPPPSSPSLPPTQAAAFGNKILWETGFIPSLFPAPRYFCLTISALSGRFSLPAANQLFPRLGRGSWHTKTRDDQGEKGKGKPSKLLLLQRLAHKHHSFPGMLSRSVQSDSPSATSCPPLEQQASRGAASLGSLKDTFLPQIPANHQTHLFICLLRAQMKAASILHRAQQMSHC